MNKIRIAFFGALHPHASILYNSFNLINRFTFIGYTDTTDFTDLSDEERLENLGNAGIQMKKYPSYESLISESPDLAIVTSTNAGKTAICLDILSRGIPVIVEKPMAVSYNDAKLLVDCAKKHNTIIITNWPITWFPAFRKAKELVDEGKIGTPRKVVYRSPATWGPYSYSPSGELPPEEALARTWWYQKEYGGGSILDYACYGAMLATWIFGRQAENVKAISKQFDTSFSDVEDYSVMILDFGNGVGLLEGSWSTYNSGQIPTGPVIYGTKGVIVCDRHSSQVKIYHGKSHTPNDPDEIIEMKSIFPRELLAEHILNYIDGTGKLDKMLDMELNLQTMYALSMGIESAKSDNKGYGE